MELGVTQVVSIDRHQGLLLDHALPQSPSCYCYLFVIAEVPVNSWGDEGNHRQNNRNDSHRGHIQVDARRVSQSAKRLSSQEQIRCKIMIISCKQVRARRTFCMVVCRVLLTVCCAWSLRKITVVDAVSSSVYCSSVRRALQNEPVS